MAIGCDTFPCGIKGVGCSKVFSLRNKIYGEIRDLPEESEVKHKMLQWMGSKLNAIEGNATNATVSSKLDYLAVYADAFINEPTCSKDVDHSTIHYLTSSPQVRLSHYLEEFGLERTLIDNSE